MRKEAAIYVAGGQTLLGSALLRQLQRQGYRNLLGQAGRAPELADQAAVEAFFADARPEYVFDAGGRSGGIAANTKYPAELIYDNLLAGRT